MDATKDNLKEIKKIISSFIGSNTSISSNMRDFNIASMAQITKELSVIFFPENFAKGYYDNFNLFIPLRIVLEKKLRINIVLLPNRKLQVSNFGLPKNSRIGKNKRFGEKIINDIIYPMQVTGKMTEFSQGKTRTKVIVNNKKIKLNNEDYFENFLNKNSKVFGLMMKKVAGKARYELELNNN